MSGFRLRAPGFRPEVWGPKRLLFSVLASTFIATALAAQLVTLRYFAGLTIPQVADQLNLSPRSADRLWAYARAFLHAEIDGEK